MNHTPAQTSARFATVFGSPGQTPRILGLLRVFWPLAPICLIAGYLLRAALPVPALSASQAGLLFLVLAVSLAIFIRWSAKRLRSFLKGAEGEEKVARVLSFLPASHTVFNDLNLDGHGASFDHVVLAPSGVFVIETKSWKGDITFENGKVLCNGQHPSRPPLRQVKEEAAHLADHLTTACCPDIPVYPVLCFVDNELQDDLTNIGGVRICTHTNLPALFENSIEIPVEKGILAIVAGELARYTESN